MGSPAVSRRAAVLLGSAGVAGALCGCGARSPAPGTSVRSSAETPPASPAFASSVPAAPASWEPGPGELVPQAKLAAVREVERRGAVHVIDAQYGGLLTDTASVLVVTTPLHTYDVRVSLVGTAWHVTAIYPSHPGRSALSHSVAARHVLASSRIALPPAARRDVLSGQVHDSVLEALLTVSRRWHVGVSVLRSGHPLDVFGTTRPSDHPRGRAFDTWAIDGHPVVSPATPRSLVVAYMEAVTAAGSYNTGGPYLLGSAPQWFSDRTHHDHVHAGFAA